MEQEENEDRLGETEVDQRSDLPEEGLQEIEPEQGAKEIVDKSSHSFHCPVEGFKRIYKHLAMLENHVRKKTPL